METKLSDKTPSVTLLKVCASWSPKCSSHPCTFCISSPYNQSELLIVFETVSEDLATLPCGQRSADSIVASQISWLWQSASRPQPTRAVVSGTYLVVLALPRSRSLVFAKDGLVSGLLSSPAAGFCNRGSSLVAQYISKFTVRQRRPTCDSVRHVVW